MRKNRGTKLFVWLLVLLQLVVCTALADTVLNVTTFNALEQTGDYTVRFWTSLPENVDEPIVTAGVTDGAPSSTLIFEKTGVAYGTPVKDLLAELYAQNPAYNQETLWTVTPDYLVLNNLDIAVQGTAVARLGDGAYYGTLQGAIHDVPAGSDMDSTVVYLLRDTTENIVTTDKSFTLDMGGHKLTSKQGIAIYGYNSELTIKQGKVQGDQDSGIVLSYGTFNAEYLEVVDGFAVYVDGSVYLYGVKARMEHCKVANNIVYGGVGGGIYLVGGSDLTGVDLTVSGNNATGGGGGIYVSGKNTTLTLEASKVTSNTTSASGGGIYLANGVVTLNSTEIRGNGAAQSGINMGAGNGAGIYIKGGSITGTDLEICENQVDYGYNGGGIYAEGGTITLTSSNIHGNTKGIINGGGVYLKNATLTGDGLTIENNLANGSGSGAGIYVDEGGKVDGTVTVNGNQAASMGAGIYVAQGGTVNGNVTVTGNTTSNIIGVKGVGVYVADGGTVNASMTISGNTGASYGGGMYVDGGNVTLSNSSVEGHQTKNNGAGIYLNSGSLTVDGKEGLTVSGNTCKAGNGGGIYVKSGTLTGDVKVTGNAGTQGAGVYVESGTVNASMTISGNTGATNGGGMYVAGGEVTLSNSSVEGHQTKNNGAGIYLNGGSLTVDGAEGLTVSGNTCEAGNGGGIYAEGSTAVITVKTSVTAENNISMSGDGGGLYLKSNASLTGGNLILTANEAYYSGGGAFLMWGGSIDSVLNVSANKAGRTGTSANGGGINMYGGALTAREGSTISGGNTSSDGGAGIWMTANSKLKYNGLTISGNTANNGGGILVQGENTIEGTNLVVSDNTAKNYWGGGGGIYLRNTTITLPAGISVKGNHSVNDYQFCCGGGIYLEGSTLTSTGGLIVEGNDAAGNGGGIYVDKGSTLSLTGSQINDNVSTNENGGGISAATASITLEDCTVNNNRVEGYKDGGGIYASEGTLTATGTTFEGNTAERNGGAIYFDSSEESLTLSGCTFQSNSAHANGAVYAAGDENIIKDCNFYENKANTDGAALGFGGGTTASITGGKISQNTGGDAGDARGALYVITVPVTIDGVHFEENKCATIISTNQDTTLTGCVIENNTCSTEHASYNSSIATVYILGPQRDLTFNNCKILNNRVDSPTNRYGKTAEIYYATNGTLTLNNTRVEGNEGSASGGIFTKSTCTVNIEGGSVITGNTGTKCGGIHIGSAKTVLNIKAGTAVYGNTATETVDENSSPANDLYIVASTNPHISIIEANQMVDGSQVFSDWYWVDSANGLPKLMKSADGKVIFDESGKVVYEAAPASYVKDRHYTAMPLDMYPVAERVREDGTVVETLYFSLSEAVTDAQDGETVRVIYDPTIQGKSSPIIESIVVDGKNIKLDLNGRKLEADTGKSAITVNPGATLTLTGIADENAHSECVTNDQLPAIVNQGTLTIGGNVSVGRIEHRGEELTLDTTGEIGTVYLDKKQETTDAHITCKPVTAGPTFNPDALNFELDADVLALLNKGYVTGETPVVVTLVKPAADVTLPQEWLGGTDAEPKVAVKGINGFVKLTIDTDGNLDACGTLLRGVFVDGQKGDDGNDGLTPVSPVKTFEQAKTVLQSLLATDPNPAEIQGIYVMGQIDVTGTTTWTMADAKGPDGKDMPLLRYPTYTGYFAEVHGNLTLSDIVLDGCGEKVAADAALIKCGGVLNIESGATLQNNDHTIMRGGAYVEAGGAVYAYSPATVNMNGGTITGNKSWFGGGICLWDATLNMNGGTISGNIAESLHGWDATGGGVAALHESKMKMHAGATVSGNLSEDVGGGISVGRIVLNTDMPRNYVAFEMDGGTISRNTSVHEGGGIHIDSGTMGKISAGEISGNSAASSGGYFGGGGIYVNGNRGYGLGTGKLYLTNVNISNNHARIAGGGLAGCTTSQTAVYVGSGGVIYNNTCDGDAEGGEHGPEVYIDNHVVNGWGGMPVAHISGYMLGGEPYKWWDILDGSADSPYTPDELVNCNNWHLTLDNPHTSGTASTAIGRCSLLISRNTSGQRGGGVGSNGFVQIGNVPTKGEWTPTGTKALMGRAMKAGEFTFTVKEGDTVVSTGTNKASTTDGQPAEIEFTPINYDGQSLGTKHTYVITEDIPTNRQPGVGYDTKSFTVNVTVIENGEGDLTGYVTGIVGGDEVAFENTYTTTPTKARLNVSKTVQGQPITPETFTFEMALKSGEASGVKMPASATAAVRGTGDAQFEEITFTKPGDYVFAIKEVAGSASYLYDQSEWEAAVKVVDENAVLKATVTYSKPGVQSAGAAEFVNPYTPSPATISLPVAKTLTGLTPPAPKTFAFTLTAQNDAPMPQDARGGVSTLTITGAGKASFGQITYTKVGTYSYVVKETAGTDKGYAYDATEYNVTVRVVDLGGRLSASWTVDGQTMDALSFVNPYQPNAVEVKLPVRKEITGGERETEARFYFNLEAVTENAPMPAKKTIAIRGAGSAQFDAIRFTQAGTWMYKVSEVDLQEQNYAYDHRVYNITVNVTDDDGVLKATWMTDSGSAETLTFINSYVTPTPTPGPEYTTVNVTKRWEDANDAEGIRPASITVRLERSVAGGAYQTVNTARLTGEGNTWTYTFDQLPARDDQGRRYQYRVREDAVDGYAVQYDGNTITNIHVAVTPTPEVTPMPTPVVVGPTPPGAKGMKFVDGEWLWIDDLGVPLGVVAQTGDNDNLPAVLGGMAVLLVIAGMLVLVIARKKNRKNV